MSTFNSFGEDCDKFLKGVMDTFDVYCKECKFAVRQPAFPASLLWPGTSSLMSLSLP